MDIQQTKHQIRVAAGSRLAAIDRFYFIESNKDILYMLLTVPEYKEAKRVFTYYSISKEVDTRAMIGGALKSGKQVFLPATFGGGKMEFREYKEGDELVKGRLNIPEPREGAPVSEPEDGDVLIVPALVYDLEGYRLGYGGGYYDRYLAGCKGFTIGLCRSRMMMGALPREEHDIPVKCIVTETKIARPE